MPHKFLRGDTVRQIGAPELLVIDRVEEPGGVKYMLKTSAGVISTIGWRAEDQLELVKRASDDDTGLGLMYIT